MLSVMDAIAEFERSLIRQRQKEGIPLANQCRAYKGRENTRTPERAAELVQRAGSGVPKALLARDYGICRETRLPVPAPRQARVNRSLAGAADVPNPPHP